MEQALFYILAAVALIATVLCITEKHPVHAIVYLVTSFFSLAIIFYLLSAPLVSVFEVIIYAGAIMVLFLFIIMMLGGGHKGAAARPSPKEWWPALLLGGVLAASIGALLLKPYPGASGIMPDLKEFARVLFSQYGVAVEIISFQLLFALVGAFYLGRKK